MHSTHTRNVTRWGAVAVAITIATLITSCSSGGGTSPSSDPSGGGTADISEYEQMVAEAEAPIEWKGPDEPAPAPAGQYVVAINCTFKVEGCKVAGEALEAVAGELGWRFKGIVVDDPTGYDQAMQTAVNEGADAIILQGPDQALVAGGIRAAKDAGIPVVSFFAYEQDQLDAEIVAAPEDVGRLMAASAIVDTGGDIHALFLDDAEFSNAVAYMQVARDTLDGCADCTVSYAKPIDFTSAIIGTTLADSVVGGLRTDPDVNAIFVGFDPPATLIIPAMNAAGYTGTMPGMYSQLANPGAMNFLREGNILLGDVGASLEWGAYAVYDAVIRLLNDQALYDGGLPVQLFRFDSPDGWPPEGEGFVGETAEFREHYLELWGR